MKLKYIHIIFGLFLLSFLLSCSNQDKLKNKLIHKKLFGGALDLTFQSSYGFMVFIILKVTDSTKEHGILLVISELVTPTQLINYMSETLQEHLYLFPQTVQLEVSVVH
jgi:hypothetical protein